MLDAACDGTFKGIYIQGEDIVQSDPNTQHVSAGLAAMECVVIQDLFLNETASYAHVFFPGSSFLEKDGTFTNAERRISRVRKIDSADGGNGGLGNHDGAVERAGLSDGVQASVGDHGRNRAPDPHVRRRDLRKDRRAGQPAVAVQRQGAAKERR